MIWGKALHADFPIIRKYVLAVKVDLLDVGFSIRAASRVDEAEVLGPGLCVQVVFAQVVIARISRRNWGKLRSVEWFHGVARQQLRTEGRRAKRRRKS